MRYFILALMFLCAACGPESSEVRGKPSQYIGHGIAKFEDGSVTCYILYEHAISCIKN